MGEDLLKSALTELFPETKTDKTPDTDEKSKLSIADEWDIDN